MFHPYHIAVREWVRGMVDAPPELRPPLPRVVLLRADRTRVRLDVKFVWLRDGLHAEATTGALFVDTEFVGCYVNGARERNMRLPLCAQKGSTVTVMIPVMTSSDW